MTYQIYLVHKFNGLPPVLTVAEKDYCEANNAVAIRRDGQVYVIPVSNIKAVQIHGTQNIFQ